MKAHETTSRELTPERFARVREVFDRAADLQISEREAFLRLECGEDDELRACILDLLGAAESTGNRFDPDAGSIGRELLERVTSSPPREIGGFTIQRMIGRGGMGTVYLAEQASPHREVALKILNSATGLADLRALGGPGSSGIVGTLQSRFGREVRALGRLGHPGIARIYEAGTADSPDGPLPYFAMEYVRGPRLTDYAAEQRLGTRERVELMARVADAVQHAHTKGVIHRDLKPGNILVSDTAGTAQPKILDFGVARFLEPDAHLTAITEHGMLIGTVAYMSPEQLDGDNDAVDVRSDVYALGVILYELLTGRLPQDVRGKPLAEAARIVKEQEPAPLNAKGNTRPERLDRDLATMVSRLLAKDPQRRYQTAAELADDLRRYLRDEPILARPTTAAYQLSKFARRHRGLVAGGVATILALVGGLVASTVLLAREQQARRHADANERLATAVRSYMIEGLLMAAAPDRMGHEAKMLDVLTRAAEGLHERFADQPDVEAGVRVDLADVLLRLGKTRESLEQWELAISLLEQTAGPDDPRTVAALVRQSEAFAQLRVPARSLSVATEALARARRALPEDDPLVIGALAQIGLVHQSQGRNKSAMRFLQEGLELARRDPDRNARIIISMTAALDECERRRNEASDPLQASRDIASDAAERLGVDSPSAVSARSNLILALLRDGRVDEATEIADDLPAAAERTFAPGHVTRAHVYRSAGQALLLAARFEEAETRLHQAREVFEASFGAVNSEGEVCLELERTLYTRWPGHAEQLRESCVQSLGFRLSLCPLQRFYTVVNLLGEIRSQCAGTGVEITDVECLETVWSRRDQWAPERSAHRATFMANFARACVKVDRREHYDEAIALAEAALPDAARPPAAQRLVNTAKSAGRRGEEATR